MSLAELLSTYGGNYLQSLLVTWRLTIISFALTMVVGLIVTVMRVCPIKPLRVVGDFYVQVFRNIPGASMMIIVVYALPYLGVLVSYEAAVIIASVMIPSAFCSENFMSGINTIGIGQVEAARSLGLTFSQMMRKVIVPQALRATVLPMTNLCIATMLTTALASQVPMSPPDLTGLVSVINTRSVGGILAFAISAVLYCGTALLIGFVGNRIDRKVRMVK